MSKKKYVAASVHMRNEFGEFITSTPVYVEADDEEVFDEMGNKIEVNPAPAIPEGFYNWLAKQMKKAIEDGTFVPGSGT